MGPSKRMTRAIIFRRLEDSSMREASCDLTSWRTKASGTGLSLPAPAKMIESHGTLALYEVFEVRCCQDDRIKI